MRTWTFIALAGFTACTEDGQAAAKRTDSLETPACTSGVCGTRPAGTNEALYDRFFEPSIKLALPTPSGVTVKVEHFDPTLPAYKFRHLLEMGTVEAPPSVFIEVWDNPTRQPLDDWFYENMQHLLHEETRVSHREVTTAHVRAIVLEQPRSEQAISLAFAIFAAEGRVYRVSCTDADAELGNFNRGLFETVLADMEVEVAK